MTGREPERDSFNQLRGGQYILTYAKVKSFEVISDNKVSYVLCQFRYLFTQIGFKSQQGGKIETKTGILRPNLLSPCSCYRVYRTYKNGTAELWRFVYSARLHCTIATLPDNNVPLQTETYYRCKHKCPIHLCTIHTKRTKYFNKL